MTSFGSASRALAVLAAAIASALLVAMPAVAMKTSCGSVTSGGKTFRIAAETWGHGARVRPSCSKARRVARDGLTDGRATGWMCKGSRRSTRRVALSCWQGATGGITVTARRV